MDQVSIDNAAKDPANAGIDPRAVARFTRPEDDYNADQVHHFAAYLSAGINGLGFPMKSHEFSDRNNPGDQALSKDAKYIGMLLSKRPSDLASIGDRIRRTFCR